MFCYCATTPSMPMHSKEVRDEKVKRVARQNCAAMPIERVQAKNAPLCHMLEENMGKTLTKAEIVEAIYEKTNKNRADVKAIVENLLEIMKRAIQRDDALLISGFGKFEAYDKNARKGRNPQTDEAITLAPRKVVVFRLSRKFRTELNGNL